MGQSWVNVEYCISRSTGDYSNGWVVHWGDENEKCVKDCNPLDGPPCSNPEHKDGSAPIYYSVEECCARLNWIDNDVCVGDSERGGDGNSGHNPPNQPDHELSNKFWADYESGSCKQDCEPGPFGCEPVPPPIALYDSIAICCAMGQSWVNVEYCTSRSIGDYSNGWVLNWGDEKCVKDCSPENGPPCSNPEHEDGSAPIYASVEECCARLSWIDNDVCTASK